jgi:hypothetical protein
MGYHDLGGSNCLTYVPLRMICNVNEQPAQGRGQLLAPDLPARVEVEFTQLTNSPSAAFQRIVELAKQFFAVPNLCQFASQQSDLILREGFSFRVCEQSIQAPRNVAYMKRNGGNTERGLIQLIIR